MIKPCPFCGKHPKVYGLNGGTELGLQCCVEVYYQLSDYLTMNERETWCNVTNKYPDHIIKKVYDIMIKNWNTRYESTN